MSSSDRSNNNSSVKASSNTGFHVSVSAPGKIILFGEHSVVYGKLALAASLGLRSKFSLKEQSNSNSVNLNLHAINLVRLYDVQNLEKNLLQEYVSLVDRTSYEKPESVNHEVLLQIVRKFMRNNSAPSTPVQDQALTSMFYLFTAIIGPLKINLEPLELFSRTDLTIGSGLGSSASFLVSAAAVFVLYARFKNRKEHTQNGINALNKEDLELISKWAFNAEKIIHGSPSGLDNTICTYGQIVAFRKGSTPKPVELHRNLQVLLINTKVPKDTKVLIAKVVRLKERYPVVVDAILESMDGISEAALGKLIELNEIRASHESYEEIGELVDVNQNLLRSLGVSHHRLDLICTILSEEGLHGKLTGAGGGGYAISVVPPNFEKTALQKVISRLKSQDFDVVLTDVGGQGILVH